MNYLCEVHVLSQGVDGTRCEADPSRPCYKQLGHFHSTGTFPYTTTQNVGAFQDVWDGRVPP